MTHDRRSRYGNSDSSSMAGQARPEPGKTTLAASLGPQLSSSLAAATDASVQLKQSERSASPTSWLSAASADPGWRGSAVVQRRQGAGTPKDTTDAGVQAVAAQGVSNASASLPHVDRIAHSFGAAHTETVHGVRAQIGGAGAAASSAIGAEAYATGSRVAFAGAPDLHTAAHEAAHVVQQAQGVKLYGGVGEAGDQHEQQADAAADAVVAGKSAAPLLDGVDGGGAAASAVQRKPTSTHGGAPDANGHAKLTYRELLGELDIGMRLERRVATGERPIAEITKFLDTSSYLVDDLAHWVDTMEDAGDPAALDWAEKATDLSQQIDNVRSAIIVVVPGSSATPSKLSTPAPAGGPTVTTPPSPMPVTNPPHAKPEATGYPEVDNQVCHDPAAAAAKGKHCDQEPVDRSTLIGAVRTDVGIGLDHFRGALEEAQLELMLQKESSWSPVVDLLITVLAIPLGPAAAELLKELKGSAKTIEAAVKAGVKYLGDELRNKTKRLPTGTAGKSAFIGLLKKENERIKSILMHDAIASLDDRELPAFGHLFANDKFYGIDACAARVSAVLSRYDAQVGSIGETRVDKSEGDTIPNIKQITRAAAKIRHKGKERVALVHAVDPYPGGAVYHEWYFERWIDADMASLAVAATEDFLPQLIGPFDGDSNKDQSLHDGPYGSDAGDVFSPTYGLIKGVEGWDKGI